MLSCLYVLHINSIHTKCTKHSEQHANLYQLMNTPKSELNWSPIKSNSAHMNATLTNRQIFLLAQFGSLLEFNCRTGVHTPPQQMHGEGGRNKGNVPIFPKASGSLMCSGNAVAEKNIHSLLQLTVACHCCENKRPRHVITKPNVWVVRWNFVLA